MSLPNLRSAIEALLFSSDQPLTLAQLVEAVEAEPALVTETLQALAEEYRAREAGVEVREMAGGWIITTTSAMHPYITRMLRGKRKMRLSRAALETLAIIAYKQPVTKTEAEAIRGVDCSGTLATLLERSLVTIKGRSTVVGRPLLYGTTDEFLNYFGLRDLAELPRPEELRALVAAREPEQMEMIEVDADGMPLALAEAAVAATTREAAAEREADMAGAALLAAGVAAGVVAAEGIDADELKELEAALDEAADPDFDDEALAAELAELDAADEDELDAEDDEVEAELSDEDDEDEYDDEDDDEYEDDDETSEDDVETTELVEEDELDEYEQQGVLVSGDADEYSDDDDADEDEDEYDDDEEYDEDGDDDFEGDDADEDDDRAAHFSETDGR